MPQTISPSEVGGSVLSATYRKIHAIQTREWAAGERVNRYYRGLTQSYRKTLEDAFFRYFVYPLDSQPHWDAVAATRNDAYRLLNDEFTRVTDDAMEETEDVSDDELEEAFLQGWYFGIWDAYQAGADNTGDLIPPDSGDISMAIGAAAIGGVSLVARARRWVGDAQLKYRTGLKGLILTEATLPGTIQWFDGIGDLLNNRISSLVVGEVHRAFELGQSSAVVEFTSLLLGQVWVTRGDAQVCPVCARLHMTVTTLKPIADSHPGCRCFLIPLLVGGGSRPIDFDQFMKER